MITERIPVPPLDPEVRYTVETLANVVGEMVKATEILSSMAPDGAVRGACLDAAETAAKRLRAMIEPEPTPPPFSIKVD